MTIHEAVTIGKKGIWLGNRILLPFHAYFLKAVVGDKVITDFSRVSKLIEIKEYDHFTSIYFLGLNDLSEKAAKSEPIKFIAVEKHDDIFGVNSHQKISLFLKDKHSVKIEFSPNDSTLTE